MNFPATALFISIWDVQLYESSPAAGVRKVMLARCDNDRCILRTTSTAAPGNALKYQSKQRWIDRGAIYLYASHIRFIAGPNAVYLITGFPLSFLLKFVSEGQIIKMLHQIHIQMEPSCFPINFVGLRFVAIFTIAKLIIIILYTF
jgi:hypothetical protein